MDSSRFIRSLARGADRALVLEAGEGADGKLKIARKGLGRFTVTVRGRPAHAGADFEHGVSAILELSLQVERLFALNDPAGGVTVNVGTIDGGLRSNVVAPRRPRVVDVRVPTGGCKPRRACAQGAGAGAPGCARSRSRAASTNHRWSRCSQPHASCRRRPTRTSARLLDQDAGLVGGGLTPTRPVSSRPRWTASARSATVRTRPTSMSTPPASRAHGAAGPPPPRAAADTKKEEDAISGFAEYRRTCGGGSYDLAGALSDAP